MSRARRTLTAALAAALGAGVAWGSLEGLHRVLEQRLLQPSVATVGLEALRSALNARVTLCLVAALLAAPAFAALRAGLEARRLPEAKLGAGSLAVALALSVVSLPLLAQRPWMPALESLAGVVARVIVVQAWLLLGMGAWLLLRRFPAALAPRLRWMLGGRWLVACALYWALVNGAFHAANAWARGAGTAEPLAARVVLLAVDGAEWQVMDPLLRRGELPNVARLMQNGAYGTLRTLEPTLSPVIWTTVATGVPMDVHGITHFVTEDGKRLVTRDMRRAKALWNILTERGRTVGVVGWLVTWPAEPVNGFVISSYAGLGRTWKGRLRRGLPRQTWPPELLGQLEPRMTAVEAELDARFRQVFPRLDASRLNDTQRDVVADTREVLLADLLNAELGVELLRERRPDFFALYLAGADVAGHRFWKYLEPQALPYRTDPDDVAMLGDVVPNYYRLVDELIGRVLEAAGPDALVVLVSDHGMRPYLPPDGDDDQASGHHEDAPPGIVVVSGPAARPGPLAVPASVFDVAPTVLYALGLPLARDMRGRPLLAALRDDVPSRHPPVYVASYGAPAPAGEREVAPEGELDRLLRERLESLGYLE